MEQHATLNATPIPPLDDSRHPVRVLIVDYSIGFGGATKGMSLMLRDLDHVEPIIATSQTTDVSELWYGRWRTYTFRRTINYRNRWRVKEWASEQPFRKLLVPVANKAFAAADAFVIMWDSFRMLRLIRRHRINVVHLANGFGPAEAMLAGRMAGVPVIAHLRGFFRGAQETGARRRIPPPTIVLGASQTVIDSYRRGSSSTVPSLCLYEAVELRKFDQAYSRRFEIRRDLGIDDDHVAVGIFGRVVEWKGQREFVAAMLRAMRGDNKLIGVVVGDSSDGLDSYFSEVKRMIADSGMKERFRFTGYIEEVEPYYWAMDIVVHASIEPEPFGMVVTEAMAAKRPVIAANAGGPLESIRDHTDGRLVDPEDSEELALVIGELAANPARRQEMGEAGYRKVKEQFDVPTIAGRLASVYQDLLTSDSAR